MNKHTVINIARATRKICAANGFGNQVVVWPDGTWSEATGPNDCVGLIDSDGTREWPIARFSWPMTRAQVAEILSAAAK